MLATVPLCVVAAGAISPAGMKGLWLGWCKKMRLGHQVILDVRLFFWVQLYVGGRLQSTCRQVSMGVTGADDVNLFSN